MTALFLFFFLYGVSIYTDLKYRKIKNIVTLPTILIGIILLSSQQGFKAGATMFVIALTAGLLLELFRIWGSGDTKLFIAASTVSAMILKTSDYWLVFYFLGANVFMYLIVGHIYTLWKSGFKIQIYLYKLRCNETIGKIPGVLPILFSNIIVLVVLSEVWLH